MKVYATLHVEVDGDTGKAPSEMTWRVPMSFGDNPHLLGKNLEKTVIEVTSHVLAGIRQQFPALELSPESVVKPTLLTLTLNDNHEHICEDANKDGRSKCRGEVTKVSDPMKADLKRPPKVWLCEHHQGRRMIKFAAQ